MKYYHYLVIIHHETCKEYILKSSGWTVNRMHAYIVNTRFKGNVSAVTTRVFDTRDALTHAYMQELDKI